MSARAEEPGRWRKRLPALVLGAALVVGVGLVAAGGLAGALTYYKTPTELGADTDGSDPTVRLGGLVVSGSVHRQGDAVSFTLTDGAKDVQVVSRSTPPSTFQAGQGAVVQGHLDSDGVFHAESVVVRHSDEYRPAQSSR